MALPLVRCASGEHAWYSRALADALRDVGSCPRCGGGLEWATGRTAIPRSPFPAGIRDVAPHLVMGVPRR